MHSNPFFNLSLDLLCVAGLDGYFKKVNPTFMRQLGYSEEELLSKPFVEFVHPDDVDATLAALEQLNCGANVVQFGNRYLCKDGSYRWLEWSCPAPEPDSDDLYAVARDVTERRNMLQELEQARHEAEAATLAKSEFLANVSHEIRTPMNAIIGVTELMARTNLEPNQSDYLQLVRESSESLLRLLNDLLDFSKIEAAKLELESTTFSFRECIERAVHSLAIQAAEKRLDLSCRIAPDVHDPVVGDAVRLRQIILNLVGNAIKFTSEGEVRVEVVQEMQSDDELVARFSIMDTGVGIAADKQDDIFAAFSQEDASTTRRFGGTGLGLAIVKQLVALMNGRIWVESDVGVGSTFHLTVSLGVGDAAQLPTADPAVLHGKRILVVDDNATNRQILSEVLESWRVLAVTVESGPQALDEARRAESQGEPYAAVILDCMMPAMDGFAVAQGMLDDPDLSTPALIMMSSAALPEHAERSRRIGITHYMTKPVVQSDLLTVLLQSFGVSPAWFREHASEMVDVGPLKILLAEDTVINREVASELLRAYGHTVSTAGNGLEAVAAVQREEFDVVLMDVQMPELDGLEATKQIRRLETTTNRHTPIVAMTAAALDADVEACRQAGMDAHIAKPISTLSLNRVLLQAVRPYTAGEQNWHAGVLPPDLADVIDVDAARSRIPGGEDGLRKLTVTMLAEAPKMMKDVEDALESEDDKRLGRACHSLASSAEIFGAARVADLARRVGKSKRSDETQGVLSELRQEHNRLIAALNAIIR